MASDFRIRADIVETGRRIWQRGYVAANDGNLSVRLSDGRILITPTGRSKGFLEPDDLVVVDARGRKLAGALEATSELQMHLFAYEARPDVVAVVHAHPPRATGFAVAGVHLAQCVLPEVILTLGGVPLAEYATPSTPEVPASIERYIRSYNAILLRSHGVLTLGKDIYEAYFRMETVEHFAEITLAARALGGAAPLSRDEVQKLLHVRENLGISAPSGTCVSCGACGGPGEGTCVGSAPQDGEPCDLADSPDGEDDIIDAVVARIEASLARGTGDPKRGGGERE
ncbi:MAG: class II aldolase/adducin family protein [Candidatus Eisenbacteria bacterium]